VRLGSVGKPEALADDRREAAVGGGLQGPDFQVTQASGALQDAGADGRARRDPEPVDVRGGQVGEAPGR
jgi:hypothetical protein